MANDRLINSTQGDSIITELRAMNTNLADIKSAMSGGSNPVAAEKDVNFYDYDGICRYSYTAAEFADLTAMPDNPTHEGLTSQGWNWSLSDAKTYVASYGKLNIGQMYASNTQNGTTLLHIRLGEGRLKPYLGLTGNSSGTAVSIDWGDNSAAESVTLDSNTVYTPHEYAVVGEYVIAITVVNGSISFNSASNSSNILRKSATANANNDKVYQNTLIKLRIGDNVTSIGNNAFQNCSSLTSITISTSVTSIGTGTFSNCSSLTSVTIPNSVTSIGTFGSCYGLTSVTIPSSVTSISNNSFDSCYSLASVTIPSSVTSIGDYAFQNCYSLTSVTIPSNVTSIGNYAFQNCCTLTSVTIPSNVTSIATNAFQNCCTLTSVTIPSIGAGAFSSCYGLTSVTILSSVTSIGDYSFQSCYSLASVTIPSSVTSIGSGVFQSCYGLGFIKFNASTPATVGSSVFVNVPTDCIIYVPTGSLSAYTSASNYPSSSTYTYVEY